MSLLQEKVLVTALKLVQQRCLVEGVLDRQVQEELLQTARQAVEAAAQQRQAEGEGQAGQEKDGEAGRLARRLEFAPGDGGVASGAGGGAGAEELLERFASHIEQGLGESLRRVERKADVATALLDQGAVEMLEARLAKGLGPLEARVAALEVQGPAPGGLGQEVLAARMEALESAVRDQQNALLELLAALRKGASQQVRASRASACGVRTAGARCCSCWGQVAPRAASVAGGWLTPLNHLCCCPLQTQGAPPRTQPAAQSAIPKAPASPKGAGTNVPTTTYPAAAKDARVSSSAPLPKLRQLRGASAAQQVALEVAKAQVRNASVQPEQEEAQPLLLTIVSVVFWVFVALLGMAALALGAVAIAVRNGMTFP